MPALCCSNREILADFSSHFIVGQLSTTLHAPVGTLNGSRVSHLSAMEAVELMEPSHQIHFLTVSRENTHHN